MLRAAIRHWTRNLQWRVDALCSEGDAARYRAELADCGATPLSTVDLLRYDLILVNTAIDAARIDSLTEKRPNLPIALWVHEGMSVLLHSPDPVAAWVRRYAKCRLVIYQTPWQRDELFKSFAALLPPERIAVVPNGVPAFDGPRQQRGGGEGFKVVCVGAVNNRKRQVDLARAVAALAREMPIDCEFIGDHTHAASGGAELTQWVASPPKPLRWLGALPHAETLQRVAAADALCLPSSDESSPLTPLEAGARGVPVVLSRLPPYQSIGWHHGVNCLQHGVRDVTDLEAQLRRLATQPALRASIAAAGKELADSYRLQNSLAMLTERVGACAGVA